jgi:hypothetical protein
MPDIRQNHQTFTVALVIAAGCIDGKKERATGRFCNWLVEFGTTTQLSRVSAGSESRSSSRLQLCSGHSAVGVRLAHVIVF